MYKDKLVHCDVSGVQALHQTGCYSLYTVDCKTTFDSKVIVKFADDTAVVGLISNDNEKAYLQEIKQLVTCYQGNGLELNVSKTKELIVDFSRKQQRDYTPIYIAAWD